MVTLEKNDFQDPYIEQSSGCFHNLLGIKDLKELSKVETALVLNRCYELDLAYFDSSGRVVDKTFDFDHLKGIHKHLFQDVYE